MKFDIIKIDLDIFFETNMIHTYATMHSLPLDKFIPNEIMKLKEQGFKFIYWDIISNEMIFGIRKNDLEQYFNNKNMELSSLFYHPPFSPLSRIIIEKPLGSVKYDYNYLMERIDKYGIDSLTKDELKYLKTYIQENDKYKIYSTLTLSELNKKLNDAIKNEDFELAIVLRDIINNK